MVVVDNFQEITALLNELQKLQLLQHRRIVQCYGGRHCDDGSFVIFMEYMPGVSELLACF